MRTTVTFDDDVAAALAEVRRTRSLGLSEAVNELIRAGLVGTPSSRPFEQATAELGLRLDVTNVAEALELLEGPARR